MKVGRHLDWPVPQIEIDDGAFNFEITGNTVNIMCEWDYGYNGRGSEHTSIPLHVFEEIIREYKTAVTAIKKPEVEE